MPADLYLHVRRRLFLKNAGRITLEHQLKRTLLLLMVLGLVINQSKSILQPTQEITYLGALFLLLQGMIYPSVDRFHSLCGVNSTMVTDTLIPAHTFLRVLGLKESCIDFVPFVKLQMRLIQFCLRSQWRPQWTRWITSFKSTTSPFHTYFSGQSKGTSLPDFQSRSNIVYGCLGLQMGSPPRESRCVGEMVSDGTVIAYKSVGTQFIGECSSSEDDRMLPQSGCS